MHSSVVEEVRFASQESVLRGHWTLPRRAAPHALAILLPDGPETNRHGSAPHLSAGRPYLELSATLSRAGVASFAFDPPRDPALLPPSLAAGWRCALRHGLASRLRVAPAAFGEGCHLLAQALPEMRATREPRGVLLVAPPESIDLRPFAGLRVRALLPEETPAPHFVDTQARDLILELEQVPGTSAGQLRLEEGFGGRAVAHPALLRAASEALVALMPMAWEQPTRPPGTAIGPSRGHEAQP